MRNGHPRHRIALIAAICGLAVILGTHYPQTNPAPAVLHVMNCAQTGCPVTQRFTDWQTVHDSHADVPKGVPGNTYPPCTDGTGYDPGACM